MYMEEETHRREYVLTETGRIWLGTVGKFCVRPWNFGQVSKSESMCLLKLVEYGNGAEYCAKPWNFGQVSTAESMCLLKLLEYENGAEYCARP